MGIVIITVLFLITGIGLLISRAGDLSSERKSFKTWSAIGVFFIAACTLTAGSVTVISSGHVGVPVYFGQVQDYTFPEGLHLKNPLLNVREMSIRTSEYTMSSTQGEGAKEQADAIQSLSEDGLSMPLEVTVVYRLVGPDAPWVYQKIGDYVSTIIRPASRTAIREGAASFTAKTAYSENRDSLANMMSDLLRERVQKIVNSYEGSESRTGVIVQDVMLRNVVLPQKVKNAIENKLEAEQEAEAMEFVLQKERKEAERKRVEAEGIRDAQKTINASLTPNYLKWYSLEMMKKLANSDNTTFMFVPIGDNGMPLAGTPVTNIPIEDQ